MGNLCGAEPNRRWQTRSQIRSDAPNFRDLYDEPAIHSLESQKLTFSPDELIRLEALKATDLLDSLPEEMFNKITLLAAELLRMPGVVISLVDTSRQWFKSNVGLLENLSETPREHAFSHYTVQSDAPDVFVVLDAKNDPRFAHNPYVVGPPYIRFYAGAPLKLMHRGFQTSIGSICIMDTHPRAIFSMDDKATLTEMADLVVEAINFRMEHKVDFLSEMRKVVMCTSQEFRTPLECMRRGMAQLEKSWDNPMERKLLFERIHSAVDILPVVVNRQIHAFESPILARRKPNNVWASEELDMTKIANTLIRISELMAWPEGVAPEFQFLDLESCDVSETASSIALQIATQFLSNACQHVPVKGTVRCKITRTMDTRVRFRDMLHPDSPRGLRVEVLDSGPGFTPELLAKAFEAFVTGHTNKGGNPTNDTRLGMGLHLVKMLVETTKGSCGVENTPSGTLQWAEVPCVILPALAESSPTTPKHTAIARTETSLTESNLRVLVIEDSMVTRRMLVRALHRRGCEVSEAPNGQAGLEILTTTPDRYDVVFVDFLMPMMHGIECVRRYREWEAEHSAGRTLIWGVSAASEKQDVADGMKAGMDGFAPKPLSEKVIREVLLKRSQPPLSKSVA